MKLLFIILFIFQTLFLFGQNQSEYKTHLKSIDKTWYPLLGNEERYHTTNANLALAQTVIANNLEYPGQYKFIADRRLLRKLKGVYNNLKIEFRDTTSKGEDIYLQMDFAKFDSVKHEITLTKNGYCCSLIDGMFPYGAEYILPSFQVDTLCVNIDSAIISIPFHAYSNLYNLVRSIPENEFERPIELYESINGEYYYLYFYGGSEASTYFGKLIFSKDEYLGRIIVDYDTLANTNSPRASFIGF
ncbi:hypothetical protein G3O08_00495 [Cryomorpha ignava]|uniref:Uncharacterized protein n=1 Tax=Cryomorpha ignava TaxID=101383 RepID=A0A7K3WM68_9FLAO|nr:hypothetical protein [Cryomorpha ignava]NEN21982.1 hypothetical protein [Cryomorpha ignava]